MPDFSENIKYIRERRRLARLQRIERFGSWNPAGYIICKRCSRRYDDHMEIVFTLCADEFRNQYPHLSD